MRLTKTSHAPCARHVRASFRIGRHSILLGFGQVAALLLGLAGGTTAMAETLEGTAMIRERIALPPGVTFEAVIEDIARADAPATPLARTVIEDPGQPPIAFAIPYDPALLTPQAQYSLRATIRRDGQLLFTTDSLTPVLGKGDAGNVEVVLKLVQRDVSDTTEPTIGAHGLRLPASFRGTLPCADCTGIRHHLDLWPGQFYHLSREWLGGSAPLRRDEIGRWYADPVKGGIVLHGASEMPLYWEVKGPDRLRMMDMQGAPIRSDLPYDLTSDATLTPTDLRGMFLLGRMTIKDGAARFRECLSGVAYPIAETPDYPALKAAYLDGAGSTGAPLWVHVEGGLVTPPGKDGMTLIVDRFIKPISEDDCARPEPAASLTETYWRIDSLMGIDPPVPAGTREPHVVLRAGAERRFAATVGCNRIMGGYTTEGQTLRFDAVASTRMACPEPLGQAETRLLEVLGATRAYRLTGQSLELMKGDSTPLATLTAVYLP